jgi:hypothetical protein
MVFSAVGVRFGQDWLSLRSSRARDDYSQKLAKPINEGCLWLIYRGLLRLASANASPILPIRFGRDAQVTNQDKRKTVDLSFPYNSVPKFGTFSIATGEVSVVCMSDNKC